MNKLFYTILYMFIALLVGCASTKPSQFYTLSPSAASVAAKPANYSISIGPVSIPAVIDRPQIVVRTDPNQVFIDEFNRWASPLKDDISRVVAHNLILILGTPQVTIFPQSPAAEASYRIVLDVLRFESEPGRAATLDALWSVRSRKDSQSRMGRTTISEPVQGGGYADLVAAHSHALGRLSAEIAGTIRKMEGKKQETPMPR